MSTHTATFTAFGSRKATQPASASLEALTLEKQAPSGHQLLVKIKGAAINPVDFKKLTAWGKIGESFPEPVVPGYDAAGVVEAVGPEAKQFKVGDEVIFAGELLKKGSFAEYTVVDERIVGRKPKAVNFEQAASLPLVTLTVWESLVETMGITIPKTEAETKVNSAKTLLVINGAGGVGSMAIQFAKHVLKLRVIATASRPETVNFCKKHGADFVITYKQPLLPQLKALGVEGVEYILNSESVAEYFDQIVEVAKPLGKICNIVGNPAEKIEVSKLQFKRLSFLWELMFTRTLYQVEPEKQGEILNQLAAFIDDGVLHHSVTQTFPFTLQGLKDALDVQQSGRAMGKLAIRFA